MLGFAQGRIVMALEGVYNLRSIANSFCACAKVLLGDKFKFNSPEMRPFESTWRVIQAVRDELKTCWPVLCSKLPENVSLRSRPSPSELYASSGSKSDVEDVDDLSGAVSSVNVIQVADDVSERLSKMKLDEDNLAMKTTSSCATAEPSPTDSVEAYNDASVVVSKRISDLSWRSVLSRTYVWYASFGSNMWKPRFLCYIQGGKAEGMSIPCCGSHDTSLPRGTMWKTVPHRLLFGRSFTPCWGTGGVAFLNPEINCNEESYVCMYKITLEQFNDVLFQENRLVLEDGQDGNVEYPDSPLIGSSEMEFMSTNQALHLEPIKDSWYSNVLYLGKEDDLPILTMTCPSSDIELFKSGELPLAPPSKTYAGTLIRGLVEGKQLDADGATNYINSAAARGL
uniref:Rpd3 n=1 Tax=Arundo donax TaxID=35708 RepID=A0A0A8YM31_ARUDO